MPCISQAFDSETGAILDVGVAALNADCTSIFQGLIDTGASKTCISPEVVQKLGLKPIGRQQMQSASHVTSSAVYVVDIFLFIGEQMLKETLTVIEYCNHPNPRF